MFDLAKAKAEITYVSKEIQDFAHDIVKREGGFVENHADSGGATNHGISLRYAADPIQGLRFDLNGDGIVDEEDIHLVTHDIAWATFLTDFFLAPNFNVLVGPIQKEVFDESVNGGKSAAAKLVQRTINALRLRNHTVNAKFPALKLDGVIGAQTSLASLYVFDAVGEKVFVNAYVDQRVAYYKEIVLECPRDVIFEHGWLARANHFRET